MSENSNQPAIPSQKLASELESVKEAANANRITNIIVACLVPAVACGGAGLYAFLVGLRHLNTGQNLNDLGNFGSYLQGTTGSFWALAGVFIIFVAFLIQTRQLFEQREQFRLQFKQQEIERAEQQRQRRALWVRLDPKESIKQPIMSFAVIELRGRTETSGGAVIASTLHDELPQNESRKRSVRRLAKAGTALPVCSDATIRLSDTVWRDQRPRLSRENIGTFSALNTH